MAMLKGSSLVLLLFSLGYSGIKSPSVTDDKQNSRLFVNFGEIKVIEGVTWTRAHFYSADGKEEVIYGKLLKPGLEDKSLDRVYYFDYPNYYKQLIIEIGPENFENSWTNTGLMKIQGSSYHLNTPNYSVISDSSGWKPIELSMNQFASYLLYDIDINSSSSCNGYNAYAILKSSFYDSLVDYSEEKAHKLTWIDKYSSKTVSFYSKWEQIQVEYKNNEQKHNNSFFYKIMGVMVCLFSTVVLFFVFKRIKRWEK